MAGKNSFLKVLKFWVSDQKWSFLAENDLFLIQFGVSDQTWSFLTENIHFWPICSFLKTYPESFWGLRFWYSTSSTVQTAPLTFSTRTKHLCNDKLWRTAFFQVAAFFLKFFRKKSLLNNFEIFENFIGRVNDDSPEICKSLHKIIVYLVQSQLFIIGFNDCLKNIF